MKKIYFFLLLFVCILPPTKAANDWVIDGETYLVDTLNYMKVGPDTGYTRLKLNTHKGSSPLMVYVMQVNIENPYNEIRSVMGSDKNVGTETVSGMAKRKTQPGAVYFGGTNADFFETAGKVGNPIAGAIVGGEVTKVPTSRPVVAIDNSVKRPFIDVMNFNGKVVTGGGEFSIASVNAGRGENQLILYNRYFGSATSTNAYGTEVLVAPEPGYEWTTNKMLKVKVIRIEAGAGNMDIVPGQAVLSGHGTAAGVLNTLAEGDVIDLYTGITLTGDNRLPNLTEMVGGDRIMLRNGEIQNNDWADLHPRTGFGFSADSTILYFCVVDGRSLSSTGCRTKQLAYIMKYAGASTAINLDGGGSSAMYIKELGVMNETSDGKERAVANGIFAVSTAPEDEKITEIGCTSYVIKLPQYSTFKPEFMGYNRYGLLVSPRLENVTLSCDPSLGYISDQGKLVVTGSNDGVLKAIYNGVETTVPVRVIPGVEMKLRLDSILIDNFREYEAEIFGKVGEDEISILPSVLGWESSDPEICRVDKGIITGVKNGSAVVTGKLDDIELNLKVNVEVPESAEWIQEDFTDVSGWTVKASSELKNVVLDNTGLPGNWTHGAAIHYTFNPGRSLSIKLTNDLVFYSLPDTIKFTYNTGEGGFSELIVGLLPNNERNAVACRFPDLPANTDIVTSIPMDDVLADVADIAGYPVRLGYMTFYIDGTRHVKSQSYTLSIKDISLCYGNVELSLSSPAVLPLLRVYPNPAAGGLVNIVLQLDKSQPVGIEIYDQGGRLVRRQQIAASESGILPLSLEGLEAGTYFLRIDREGATDRAKLIVK